MGGREGGKSLIFIVFPIESWFRRLSKKIEILKKTGGQKEAKIDAKIIEERFWAARGATHVDLEYFLEVF